MKLVSKFDDFLKGTVNLNDTRIRLLEKSIDAVKSAVKESEWKPKILDFEAQGSWAHQTIIKPLSGSPFDADLIIYVEAVDDWEAKDYVNTLFTSLNANPNYKGKLRRFSHCVTIEYAGERKIDLAPCVRGRLVADTDEVCNRNTNEFETSAPKAYSDWLVGRNGKTGSNSFRKVTRLLKYLRDIKTTFTCPSFLLTTLLGLRVFDSDQGSDEFSDTPTALKTLLGRLDDWLQTNPTIPEVRNPVLWSEVQSTAWDETKYSNFRDRVHQYRSWVDDAYDEQDRDESIGKWRRIFGDDFAKGETLKKAENISEAAITEVGSAGTLKARDLVDLVMRVGRSALPSGFFSLPHMQRPTWPTVPAMPVRPRIRAELLSESEKFLGRIESMTPVQRGNQIRFEALQANGLPLPDDYKVEWRVTNTDKMAQEAGQLRGGFYPSKAKHSRIEGLSFRGVHMVEGFLIRRRDGKLIGRSEPFLVVIE